MGFRTFDIEESNRYVHTLFYFKFDKYKYVMQVKIRRFNGIALNKTWILYVLKRYDT